MAQRSAEEIRSSIAWKLTWPLRTASNAVRGPGKRAVVAATRPAVDAALRTVRENDGLKSRLHLVLHRIPGVEARVQSFANSRRTSQDPE